MRSCEGAHPPPPPSSVSDDVVVAEPVELHRRERHLEDVLRRVLAFGVEQIAVGPRSAYPSAITSSAARPRPRGSRPVQLHPGGQRVHRAGGGLRGRRGRGDQGARLARGRPGSGCKRRPPGCRRLRRRPRLDVLDRREPERHVAVQLDQVVVVQRAEEVRLAQDLVLLGVVEIRQRRAPVRG